MRRGKVVYRHISLNTLGMSREQAQEWAEALNEHLGDEAAFARAVVTNEGALAIDATLLRAMERRGLSIGAA